MYINVFHSYTCRHVHACVEDTQLIKACTSHELYMYIHTYIHTSCMCIEMQSHHHTVENPIVGFSCIYTLRTSIRMYVKSANSPSPIATRELYMYVYIHISTYTHVYKDASSPLRLSGWRGT